jgi:hypothetical protein
MPPQIMTISYEIFKSNCEEWEPSPPNLPPYHTMTTGILEPVEIRLLPHAWEVRSRAHAPVPCIGLGETKQQAILNWLQARLGLIKEEREREQQ